MPVELTNSYGRLRQRLSVHLKDRTPGEIGVPLPVSLDDELSFYRLVMWGYALIQEAAKVPLAFLTNLPPMNLADPPLRDIALLRTWIGHNLSLGSDRDIKTLRKAHVWLRNSCTAGTPSTPQHWESCCNSLYVGILDVLHGATAACDALDDETDGDRLVDDLKSRIDNQWEAFRFDSYVTDAAARLGYVGLDIVKFRSRHLDEWRRVVQNSDFAARDRLLTQHVEANMADLMANALPNTAMELASSFCLQGPERVAAALILLREAQRSQPGKIDYIIEQVCLEASRKRQEEKPISDD